jgi:branched-chain amino acid transport system permease protein
MAERDGSGRGFLGRVEFQVKSLRQSSPFVRLFILATAIFSVLGFALSPAQAEDSEYALRIQVKDQVRTSDGKTDNQPVPGVEVTVTDSSGIVVETGTTDAEGVLIISVPTRADYTVTLNEATLPSGEKLDSRTPAIQNVLTDSFVTKTKVITYFTGESQNVSQSGFERVAQRFSDGIRLGLILAMCSVGLSLIFGTTGLTNFAHGEMVTFGGIMAFVFNVTGLTFLGFLGFIPGIRDDGTFHIFWAAPIGIILGGGFGWALNKGIFGPLRRRGVGLVTQMVLTVGLSIALRNFFLSRFEGRTRPFADFSLQKAWDLGPINITPRDFTVSILCLIILVVTALGLRFTRLGKATRAVSDNPDLASATGIDSEKVIRLVWILGGCLAAAGGIFRGLDEQVSFDMGGRLLFLLFAGITLGGLGSAFGALVGGFVIGILVEVSSLVVPTELKTAPALIILILVLLLRPQGILGRAQRVG